MDASVEKRFIAIMVISVVLSLVLSGAASILAPEPSSPPGGGNGDGDNGPAVNATYGVDIGYLDDTQQGDNYTWTTLISDRHDMGVVWINNTGTEDDVYRISINEIPDGWSVSTDQTDVAVRPFDDMGVVILSFSVPNGAIGENNVSISVRSLSDPSIVQSMTLICIVESTDQDTTTIGDTILVEYFLTDTEGNVLDPGGPLPVTAGELYVGSGNQMAYIDGFYMSALGLRLPELGSGGETKIARIPPELAYGETPMDEGGHTLGGITLLFTIKIVSDIPG